MLKELNEGGANALAAAEKEMEQTASVYLAVPVWENVWEPNSVIPDR